MKTYKPTAVEMKTATSQLAEIIADLDSRITKESAPVAFNCMYRRLEFTQLMLLGKLTPEKRREYADIDDQPDEMEAE